MADFVDAKTGSSLALRGAQSQSGADCHTLLVSPAQDLTKLQLAELDLSPHKGCSQPSRLGGTGTRIELTSSVQLQGSEILRTTLAMNQHVSVYGS